MGKTRSKAKACWFIDEIFRPINLPLPSCFILFDPFNYVTKEAAPFVFYSVDLGASIQAIFTAKPKCLKYNQKEQPIVHIFRVNHSQQITHDVNNWILKKMAAGRGLEENPTT